MAITELRTMALTPTAGKRRTWALQPGARSLEVLLEDRRGRDSDGALDLAKLVRVRIADPTGVGFHRSLSLSPGMRALLDITGVPALEVEVLVADNLDVRDELRIAEFAEGRPRPREDAVLFDLVDYGLVATGQDYTPPPGARRWWLPQSGTSGPSIASWRHLGGEELLAGGVSGSVLGPLFRFSAAGQARVVWELAP